MVLAVTFELACYKRPCLLNSGANEPNQVCHHDYANYLKTKNPQVSLQDSAALGHQEAQPADSPSGLAGSGAIGRAFSSNCISPQKQDMWQQARTSPTTKRA